MRTEAARPPPPPREGGDARRGTEGLRAGPDDARARTMNELDVVVVVCLSRNVEQRNKTWGMEYDTMERNGTYLMRANDELEVVGLEELLRDVRAERVARAARRDAPAAPLVRVGPHEVAHGACTRAMAVVVIVTTRR